VDGSVVAERAGEVLQIVEQIRVVDDEGHLVLGAETAAAAHPSGESAMLDDTDLGRACIPARCTW